MAVEKKTEDNLRPVLEGLPGRVIRFRLRPEEQVIFPGFPGVTIRGALCSVMKDLVCVSRQSDCRDCCVQRQCAFARLFVSMPPEDAEMMKLYPSRPHPFVLRYPEGWGRRAKYRGPFGFAIHLLGDAVDCLPFIVKTVQQLGENGLGAGRGRFELDAVRAVTRSGEVDLLPETDEAPDVPPICSYPSADQKRESDDTLSIRLVTPARVRKDGSVARKLEPETLVAHLLRRLSALAYFNGGGQPDLDFRGLVEEAGDAEIARDETIWESYERYSGRQDRTMPFGGLLGKIEYRGLSPMLAELIAAGSFIGAGRHTTFGFGHYRVVGS